MTDYEDLKKEIAANILEDIKKLSGTHVDIDVENLNEPHLEHLKDKVSKLSDTELGIFFEMSLLLDPENVVAQQKSREQAISPQAMRNRDEILDEAFRQGIVLTTNNLMDLHTFQKIMVGITTIHPLHYDAQTRLVKIFCMEDKPEYAVDIVNMLLECDPGSARALAIAGDFHRYQGHTQEAFHWSDRAIRAAQKSGDETSIKRAHASRDAISRDIVSGKCPPLNDGHGSLDNDPFA